MNRKNWASCLPAVLALVLSHQVRAQSLPPEIRISDDGHRLVTGGEPSVGFYDEGTIQTVELRFDQANYWQLLTNNYASQTEIPATMIVNGVTYTNVGVRFRGNTSYQRVQGKDKKSFNISLDFVDEDQEVGGYNSMNFNNAYEDPSFLHEVLYLNLSRKHIPSAKANFIHLYINGVSWGLYPNVQQLDGKYLKEWFLSNDGTRWRGERSTTTGTGGGPGGPGGGGNFGAGTSSLNWLGADTSLYVPNYTLKKANKENPWDDLVKACDVLNNTPLAQLEDSLNRYMDVDRTLWYLAHEIIFGDDDSYVNKGGMDYYLYWEVETGRLVPLEYDGNSAMETSRATWSPFYNQNDTRFALMNRLFAVPALRQRYLAHVRTIIEESLDQEVVDARIDSYVSLIDSVVQADTKKLYTYNQFLEEVEAVRSFVTQRRQYLLNNAEVAAIGPNISSVSFSGGETEFEAPAANEGTSVTAQIVGSTGVRGVNLYYSTGVLGRFEKTAMYDDGAHNDGAAGDGLYGGTVPGFGAGTYVRFYIEAVANNSAGTVSYMPKGAEHDVYFYRVKNESVVLSTVVINEILASNEVGDVDQDGEHDDWIELYNNSSEPVDISGWHMSDDEAEPMQWTFPPGTVIAGNGYLIVWADEDDTQNGLHASFKISASGETVLLTDGSGGTADRVEFGAQETDVAYARIPNGTGEFVAKAPTFHMNNESTVEEKSPVVINELMASNETTVTDQDGENDDWIELYNNSSEPVDIGGWHMSDDVGNPTMWTFPAGTLIPGNGYLIVWADEDDTQNGLHAGFKLSASGETVLLVDAEGEEADRVEFGEQNPDASYARIPNGTGEFVRAAPTFNMNNETVPVALTPVAINEILASNAEGTPDQDGEFDDWIELYNNASEPVDLGGWHMSDDESDLMQWTFPAGTIIPGNSYLIVWADEDDGQVGLHAGFKISASGETILLTNPEGEIAQRVEFGAMESDVAYARIPNGTGDFVMQAPTFGVNNEGVSSVRYVAGDERAIRIVPNPAVQSVTISTNATGIIEVDIRNALGERVMQMSMRGEATLDVSDLPPGLYLVRIGDAVQKLIVQ